MPREPGDINEIGREPKDILKEIGKHTKKIEDFKKEPPIETQLTTEPNNLEKIVKKHDGYVGLIQNRQKLIKKYIEAVK